MDKLPLEIWEHIVRRTIWAPKPFDPKEEKWEDGPIKLELAEFHPLPHYLEGLNKRKPTDAETSLVALMGTSKEFKRICERFTRQLLSARGTLYYSCVCEEHGVDYCDCGDSEPHWGFSINRGKPSAHTRVLNVLDVESENWEELYYGEWPEPLLAAFAPLRQCSALASLSLNSQTLPWLPPLLNALPGGGARLKQLRVEYPDRYSNPSEAELEGVLAAISRCTSLDVLDLDHMWENERPDNTKAIVFAVAAIHAVPWLRALRLSWLGGDPASHVLKGKTAAQIVRQPLKLAITRLAFKDADIELDIIEGVIESCSGTLEYLNLESNFYFSTLDATESHPSIAFPRLRYVAVEGWNAQHGETPNLGAGILPAHWVLPAVEHLYAEEVAVDGQEGIDTFTQRLLSWTTLRYLRIEGRLSDDGWMERVEEDQEDSRYGWAARLQTDLRAKGVDANLEF